MTADCHAMDPEIPRSDTVGSISFENWNSQGSFIRLRHSLGVISDRFL